MWTGQANSPQLRKLRRTFLPLMSVVTWPSLDMATRMSSPLRKLALSKWALKPFNAVDPAESCTQTWVLTS